MRAGSLVMHEGDFVVRSDENVKSSTVSDHVVVDGGLECASFYANLCSGKGSQLRAKLSQMSSGHSGGRFGDLVIDGAIQYESSHRTWYPMRRASVPT